MLKISPLNDIYEKFGATFAPYFGWRMPASFTDYPSCEEGLLDGSVAFDLSPFGRFEIKGSKAASLIAGATGSDIVLGNNTVNWCDCVVRVVNMGDSVLLLSHPADNEALLAMASELCRANKLTVTDVSSSTAMFGLYGPKAYETLSRLAPGDVSLEPGKATRLSVLMFSFVLVRASWAGTDGLEVICGNNIIKFAAGPIEKYHSREGIIPGTTDCLDKATLQYLKTFA